MLFHVFNIDQKSDSEVYIYGKECDKNEEILTLRVINVISPVYLMSTPFKEDLLIKDLENFTKEIKDIKVVKRTNIFNKSLKKDLELFKVTLKKNVNFTTFYSEYCDFLQTEFSSPVENLIISKNIMGPGILQLNNVNKRCVEYQDILFLNNAKFNTLKVSSIVFESKNGTMEKFVYYNDANKIFHKGILIKNDDSEKVNLNYKKFSDPKQINAFINELIRKESPDVILVHNFHLKSRLNIRDKIFCDIFQFASGTIKGRDFSIQEICSFYKINKGKGLEGDAVGLVAIFEAMNALGLAKEMAEISGYLLNKCLSNSRAERIEYTLIHDLYGKDYLLPSDTPKKDTKYSGGLVFEPIQAFYEDIVLLLDFNSLYPSIIQEFNVCFSTVGSSNFYLTPENTDGILKDPEILSSIAENQENSFLPKILRNLVKRRRGVKEMIKNCKSPEEKAALDIRQQALKLTANSIYGCLGFTGSRFCNFEMAAFITAKGREILGETKVMAESMNMKVIYGDTDSIMIHTKYPGSTAYYDQAIESSKALIKKINSKYTSIEIELEKAFKKLLLYTKKKYAALVFDKSTSFIETKGIDLVRRDFCRASSDLSRTVLNIILDDRESKENPKAVINNTSETCDRIYKACSEFYNSFYNRPVDDFIISSGISKDISQYTNSNLPHITLALRLKNTKGMVFLQDDVIPYVIGEGSGPISTRSFHPDEVFLIDYSFYIKNQVLAPLFRLISLVSNIHCEKIGFIFNVKDFGSKIITRTLSFSMPCCGNIQECAFNCGKCGSDIKNEFYFEKVNLLIKEAISNLYHTNPTCVDCERVYSNHFTRCLFCNKDLKCNFKNYEFNQLIDAIDTSFKRCPIPDIEELVSIYSEISTYRAINMRRYFSNELERGTGIY